MRSNTRLDQAQANFTLACAGYGAGTTSGTGLGDATNLTFTIGSRIVAEIGHRDLMESWAAIEELTAPEGVRVTEVAAGHLSGMLESGSSVGDLAEAVTDAAVVFLFALRRSGISDPKRIPACRVMWNGREKREHVVLGA